MTLQSDPFVVGSRVSSNLLRVVMGCLFDFVLSVSLSVDGILTVDPDARRDPMMESGAVGRAAAVARSATGGTPRVFVMRCFLVVVTAVSIPPPRTFSGGDDTTTDTNGVVTGRDSDVVFPIDTLSVKGAFSGAFGDGRRAAMAWTIFAPGSQPEAVGPVADGVELVAELVYTSIVKVGYRGAATVPRAPPGRGLFKGLGAWVPASVEAATGIVVVCSVAHFDVEFFVGGCPPSLLGWFSPMAANRGRRSPRPLHLSCLVSPGVRVGGSERGCVSLSLVSAVAVGRDLRPRGPLRGFHRAVVVIVSNRLVHYVLCVLFKVTRDGASAYALRRFRVVLVVSRDSRVRPIGAGLYTGRNGARALIRTYYVGLHVTTSKDDRYRVVRVLPFLAGHPTNLRVVGVGVSLLYLVRGVFLVVGVLGVCVSTRGVVCGDFFRRVFVHCEYRVVSNVHVEVNSSIYVDLYSPTFYAAIFRVLRSFACRSF